MGGVRAEDDAPGRSVMSGVMNDGRGVREERSTRTASAFCQFRKKESGVSVGGEGEGGV